MFTGLVEMTGRIAARHELVSGVRLSIEHGYDASMTPLDLGESVAVNGACLTVAAFTAGCFEIDASIETLAMTTLESWKVGDTVNLERALALGARLGGHLVTGHVDGVGEVLTLEERGDMTQIGLRIPPGLARYVARKGSLCVDGVSLTVNDVTDLRDAARADLLVIPHTKQATTLGQLRVGTRVNLEIDLIARYIERLLPGEPRNQGQPP